jgi:hypothetical protein
MRECVNQAAVLVNHRKRAETRTKLRKWMTQQRGAGKPLHNTDQSSYLAHNRGFTWRWMGDSSGPHTHTHTQRNRQTQHTHTHTHTYIHTYIHTYRQTDRQTVLEISSSTIPLTCQPSLPSYRSSQPCQLSRPFPSSCLSWARAWPPRLRWRAVGDWG